MTPATFIEHIALNVPDPVAMANWYCDNLALTVVLAGPGPIHGRFLADATGRVLLEIYHNPAAPIPDYPNLDPLTLHLAFATPDVPAAVEALTAAGATTVQPPQPLPDQGQIAMLRDPWGLPLQLLHRAQPLTHQ